MKRITRLVAAAALAAAGLAMLSSPARAQAPPVITITFKLTLNGTVPPQYSFGVEHEVELCAAPCVGGGHTYTKTISWLKGTTPVQFVFARFIFVGSGTPVPDTKFGQQTVIPTANRTVSAFFTFEAPASVSAPATGAARSFPAGAGLVAMGSALLLLVVPRRRRSDHPLRTSP